MLRLFFGAGLNFALAGIRGKHKIGEWGRRGLIALLLIRLGLAGPLASRFLSSLPKSSELEEEIPASLPDNLRLVFVNRASGSSLEIKVESDAAGGKETLPQLKGIIRKRENQKRASD